MQHSLGVIVGVVVKEEETGEGLASMWLPLVKAARTVCVQVYL